ncbi:AMP-binding protein [Nocardia sp. NPDC059239]|uniref:AMP-binding protein n=1 Tax=unclassified Nocardia TaxID=2637762 RepID=UPI0036B17F9C
MLDLAVLLEDTARRHPGHDAIVAGDQRLTYAKVDAAANRIAHLLAAHDIRPGDKVALSCPNLAWFGIPHDSHREEIKAYVIAAPGTTPSESSLIEWAKQHMAAYKYPRQIEFVSALPMTSTGKILKRELRTPH